MSNTPATPEELARWERECRENAEDTWAERKEMTTDELRQGLDEWLIIGKLTVEQRAFFLSLLPPL